MGYGSKMDGCGQCMKYSLFIANFVICLGGIAVTAVGAVTLRDQSIFETLVGDGLYKSSSYVLIGTGVFIMVFAFMGCYGAVKEVKCFLLMYIIVLLIFFVVLLIGGVLGYVFKGKVSEPMKTEMMNSMKKYNDSDTVKTAWDNVQTVFQCCGIDGYDDWSSVFTGPEKVPVSCCQRKEEEPTCQKNPTIPSDTIWTAGCLTKLKEGGTKVGIVGIVVACLLVLGLIFSYGVFRSIT